VRGLLARRGRIVSPVQAQQTFVNPAWIPPWRRDWTIQQLLRRPGRLWQPPWAGIAAPGNPVLPLGTRRPRAVLPLRRRAAYVMPVAHPGGHIVPTPHRVRLMLAARRGRPFVPLAATALPVSSPKPVRVRPLAVRRARSAQLRLIGLASPPRTGRLASSVIGAGNSSGPRTSGMSSGPRTPGTSSTTTRPGMSSGTTSARMVSGT
jgi:hypothetical protein